MFQGVTLSFHPSDYQFSKEFTSFQLTFFATRDIISYYNLLFPCIGDFNMNVKKLISKSLDLKYFATGLIWFSTACILFAVLAIVLSVTNSSLSALRIASTFLLIFLVPVTVYYIVRIVLLYVNTQDYQLYTATSTEVHNNHLSLWRSCYFVLEVSRDDGSTFTAESCSIFRTSDFSSSYFGNYIHKPLQVLYNSKNETIIVIGETSST